MFRTPLNPSPFATKFRFCRWENFSFDHILNNLIPPSRNIGRGIVSFHSSITLLEKMGSHKEKKLQSSVLVLVTHVRNTNKK